MVPAMTARDEKIAPAAAEPMIGRAAPAAVAGAGRVTSVVTGGPSRGSGPAGTRTATGVGAPTAGRLVTAAGTGGRASSSRGTRADPKDGRNDVATR